MARMTKRVLSDEQWQRIAPYLPQHPPSPKGGRPRANDRECLEGILWLLRSGARWRDIPVDLPSPSTCWRRLQEWAAQTVLEDLQAALVGELEQLGKLDLRQLLADATFIRCKKGGRKSAKPRLARV
ncbi:MAG TPA: transposase [Gemmataceae bacterium]|nr:transposase [Gemmataceae bacterium]